ncbi:bone morphogenetic protein 7-like [Takifugu flavidus]|uniref:Bone morphogenetic protein 7 n=1 Tax=Takifugu flavidus TaxID=433684 RepID=A0A5C6N3P8_9TELE|nr:bone morphogenetic protein 7-like [Takifugu flavidus]TWW61803.1 Bone morphogenetic protein 7 [Takifugu flavidus]
MVASAPAAVTLLLCCCFGSLVAQIAFSNFSTDNEVRSSFIQRRLRSQERREMQREILSILGLPQRPRPQVHTKHTAAPMFMMDLYNTISEHPEIPRFSYYRPVYHSSLVTPQDNRFLDDADTVMSFANLIEHEQDLPHRQHRREFRFDLSGIPDEEVITGAEFRIYKQFTREHFDNQTFRVSLYQVLQESTNSDLELLLLEQRELWPAEEGWLAFDLTATSNLWLDNPEDNLGLHLVLEDSRGQRRKPQLAGLVTSKRPQEKQPFMVAFFRANGVRFRSVRSAHGHKGRHSKGAKPQRTVQDAMRAVEAAKENLGVSKEGCKKHELYVSFRDLGWQDWIIAPEGYAAYYCDGECAFPLNSYMNATNHAIVQTLVHFINPETVPKPCCAPTQLHGISVLYFDDSSNVILKKYRNMVVRACGCH